MLRKKIIIKSIFLFFILSYSAFAQEESVIEIQTQEQDMPVQKNLPDDIKTRLDTFFTQLQTGNMEPAVMDLVKGAPIENKTQELNLVISQLRNLPIIYGPILSIEALETKYAGDSLLMARYLVKLRDHPAIFEFYYYKSQDNWTLLKFWFNDQIQSLF